jgi:hypothetical protein
MLKRLLALKVVIDKADLLVGLMRILNVGAVVSSQSGC